MRLIDADSIDYDDYWYNKGFTAIECQKAQQLINEQPTVEERKVGKWIGERGYPICEKCGCNIYEKYISCSDYAEIIAKMDYCPNCGADMRGAENE